MAEKHSVVRTDLMWGTDVRAGLVSVKYMGAEGSTPTAIDNGHVLKVEELLDGEREIYKGVDVVAEDTINNIVLIATPEVMYDERLYNLDDFYNEAGKACRGYRLHSGDIFSVTEDALDGSPAVKSKVTLKAGTKLEVAGSGTEIGVIIDKNIVGRYTYYAIKVN